MHQYGCIKMDEHGKKKQMKIKTDACVIERKSMYKFRHDKRFTVYFGTTISSEINEDLENEY